MEKEPETKRRKISNEIQNRTNIFTGDDNPHLFRIFPEEVWRLILANVNQPNTYRNICGTSPVFKNLIQSQRTLALFPDVAPILIERFAHWEWEWKEETDSDEDDPSLPDYREGFRDLASLRAVCRTWRNGVDNAIQNLNYHYQFPDERKSSDGEFFRVMFQHYLPRFSTLAQFIRLENHFGEAYHANPFTTRSIEITLPSAPPQIQPFHTACLSLLRKYGSYVWYMGLNMYGKTNLVTRLREILELLPNLKVLRLDFGQDLQPEIVESLHQDIRIFPSLPNLKYVDQIGMSLPLLHQLIQNKMPNLTQIGVNLGSEQEFQDFCALNVTVKKLRLDVNTLSLSWREIFTALERQFGNTITDLHLWLPKPTRFRIEDRLTLPKLTKLHLRISRAVPLDILLNMKDHLEELSLKTRGVSDLYLPRNEERVVKFYYLLFANQIYKSNIWEEFTNLKIVTAWCHYWKVRPTWACTRDFWKARKDLPEEEERRESIWFGMGSTVTISRR